MENGGGAALMVVNCSICTNETAVDSLERMWRQDERQGATEGWLSSQMEKWVPYKERQELLASGTRPIWDHAKCSEFSTPDLSG